MAIKFILLVSLFGIISAQSHDICNFTMKVERKLRWYGFHRNLTYHIVFENHSIDKKDKPVYYYHECVLAIQQLIPAGLYVDPDELENLRRYNKLSAYPQNGVSIEAAEPHARPFYAYIFAPVESFKVETFLPVHARYHKPAPATRWFNFSQAEIVIEKPSAFLRCLDNRLEKCDKMKPKSDSFLCKMETKSRDKKQCLWKEVAVETSNRTLVLRVPIGNLSHYYVVETITMAAVVMGSLLIIHSILQHPVTSRMNLIYND